MKKNKVIRFLAYTLIIYCTLAGLGCEPSPKSRGKAEILFSPAPFSVPMIEARLIFLKDYLTKETDWKIEMRVSPSDIDSFLKMVETEKVAFSLQNAYFYLLLAEKKGAVPIVKTISLDGRAERRGLIVCRDDSQVKSVADLRGKQVLSTSRFHVGGFLSQWIFLKDQGLNPERDLIYKFGDTQEEILEKVASGRAEVGFIREDVLQAAIKTRGQMPRIKVIATTSYCPTTCIVKYPGTDPDLVEKVKTALLKLNFKNPSHRFILERLRISGFAPASPEDYADFRNLLTSYGLLPARPIPPQKTTQSQ